MKKITFLVTILSLALMSQAQQGQYDEIKNRLLLGGTKVYEDAKNDVDKKMGNTKFASKPEAYMLKATIYSYLAGDSLRKVKGEASALQAEAETAFKKYLEMQPGGDLIKDPIYKNAPIYIYSNLFDDGYKEYAAKKYAESFSHFKRVAEYSDVLAKHGLLSSPVDTNTLILAAYTAENSNNKDEASIYYKKLADAKVKGDNYESIYRFLVTYSFEKKNMDEFEKYKEIGKQLYPNSEFFTYDKVDFAVGLEENFASKLKALEQQLATDPNNYKANLSVAQLIYDTLHKEESVKPANAAELETKLVTALNRIIESKPDDVLAYLILGDHYINRSIDIDKDRETHVADMKKRTQPGKPASKDDVAKRDALDKAYADAFENARQPYEKAAEIYGKRPLSELKGPEKQQYKKVAGYLGDIYTFKVGKAKGKPAEIAKYEAEEKKWNDLYVSIK